MKLFLIIITFFLFTNNSYAIDSDKVIIHGNDNIDKNVIFSIISDLLIVENINENLIIKKLFESGNFKDISITNTDTYLNIFLTENPSINDIAFEGNERFKTEEIFEIFSLINNLNFYNEKEIILFIKEFKKLYYSFGYNQVEISYETAFLSENLINLNFKIKEGEISKINKVFFSGNDSISRKDLLSIITSREKNTLIFFTSKNYKAFEVKNDKFNILNYYKENGFKNIEVDYKIEYLRDRNKFNIYFNIIEGTKFLYKSVDISIPKELLDAQEYSDFDVFFNLKTKNILTKNNFFNIKKLKQIQKELTDYLFTKGLNFFEINILEKSDQEFVEVLFNVISTSPKYVNQINIIGNSRTLDKVIRREMAFVEGNSVTDFQISESKKNLSSLNIFETIDIQEVPVNNNLVDINVTILEKSTGDFQVGLALGSLQGASFITSLNEKNISGTGRNLELAINTSEVNTVYKVNVVEPYVFNQNFNLLYGASFRQRDYSSSASYEVDSFDANIGVSYEFNTNLYHNLSLIYEIKDYTITNSTTVANSIASSEGTNAAIKIENLLNYNTLNSYIRPTNGTQFIYANVLSPITNSDNGYIKNVLTYKKYFKINKNNNFSIQSRLGNISSLQNSDILTDDKFSLGGRWLRGFDSFGVGPRSSSTSYYGGNNIAVTKIDFKRSVFNNADNPVDLNLFTDFGTVFENKTDPSFAKESIRSSYGIGLNFYSPIGPIGLSWGFPITDESYDIKRQFLFSIGSVN